MKPGDIKMLEFHVVIDGLVHVYKGIEHRTPTGFARSHTLMCGRLFAWVKEGDGCIVDTMVTCVACLGNHPKNEAQRPWYIEPNAKE